MIGRMAPVNVFSAKFEYDGSDPVGYASGVARVGKAAGGTENAVKLFELPPGVKLCPYHYEYAEEWLLVLEGPADVRGPRRLADSAGGIAHLLSPRSGRRAPGREPR